MGSIKLCKFQIKNIVNCVNLAPYYRLQEQINHSPTSRLHQLLAELLRRKKDHTAAFDHFAKALR